MIQNQTIIKSNASGKMATVSITGSEYAGIKNHIGEALQDGETQVPIGSFIVISKFNIIVLSVSDNLTLIHSTNKATTIYYTYQVNGDCSIICVVSGGGTEK